MVIRFGFLGGLFTGSTTIFLLLIQSIILISPTDPIDLDFYTGYCFIAPAVATLLGTTVGSMLALFIEQREKLMIYVSISALVIATITSLIGLNLLLEWKGI